MVSYGISHFDQCGYDHSLNLFQRMKPCEFWGQLHKFSFVTSIRLLQKYWERFLKYQLDLSCVIVSSVVITSLFYHALWVWQGGNLILSLLVLKRLTLNGTGGVWSSAWYVFVWISGGPLLVLIVNRERIGCGLGFSSSTEVRFIFKPVGSLVGSSMLFLSIQGIGLWLQDSNVQRAWKTDAKNGGHLFPSAKLTFSSQLFSQDVSLFLHEISVHKISSLFQFLRKKNSEWHK